MPIHFLSSFLQPLRMISQAYSPSPETWQKIHLVAQDTLKDMAYLAGACALTYFIILSPIDAIGVITLGAFAYYLFKPVFDSFLSPTDSSEDNALTPLSQRPASRLDAPPPLKNPFWANNCFMNAAFQMILQNKTLKEGLKTATDVWITRYEDLRLLSSYLNNKTQDVVVWTSRPPSDLSFFFIPSVLALFAHEDFSELRQYLRTHLPLEIKISFETLISHIHDKKPFDPLALFHKTTHHIQILGILTHEDAKLLIAEAWNRLKGKKDAFIKLKEILNACDHPHRSESFSPVSLNPLRAFLITNHTQGQQDAADFLGVMLNLIAESGIPFSFFFQVKEHLSYHRVDPDYHEDLTEERAMQLSSLPSNNQLTKIVPDFQLCLPLLSQNNPCGQTLLDTLSSWHQPSEDNTPAHFINQEKIFRYQLDQQKVSFPSSPERFILSLKRSFSDGRKNDAPVSIPEMLYLQGKMYQIQSAVIHEGSSYGGHYWSLVRQVSDDGHPGWWLCNDDNISEASTETIKHALTYGSFYLFEKLSFEEETKALMQELPYPLE